MIKEGQIYREAFFFSQGYNKAQKKALAKIRELDK